jgi:hypothetical protein
VITNLIRRPAHQGRKEKARRCETTRPVDICVLKARTSCAQRAVGPAIRTSASQEGSYTAQTDPAGTIRGTSPFGCRMERARWTDRANSNFGWY